MAVESRMVRNKAGQHPEKQSRVELDLPSNISPVLGMTGAHEFTNDPKDMWKD